MKRRTDIDRLVALGLIKAMLILDTPLRTPTQLRRQHMEFLDEAPASPSTLRRPAPPDCPKAHRADAAFLAALRAAHQARHA